MLGIYAMRRVAMHVYGRISSDIQTSEVVEVVENFESYTLQDITGMPVPKYEQITYSEDSKFGLMWNRVREIHTVDHYAIIEYHFLIVVCNLCRARCIAENLHLLMVNKRRGIQSRIRDMIRDCYEALRTSHQSYQEGELERMFLTHYKQLL